MNPSRPVPYRRGRAAAHAGDAARVTALAAGGADLNAPDGYGRTPLHVATFARQRGVIQDWARLAPT